MTETHGELLHVDEAQALALRAARLDADVAERLADRFRALGDPSRLGLALALRDAGELCVCDLSWIAQRPQNLTSHHMKVLRGAGIVSAKKQGKMTMYRLTDEGRQLVEGTVAEHVDTPRAQPARPGRGARRTRPAC
jgi:ArsR family transcriptional regulator, lead/cadmium/zinc/bismuth-responsive transcriptional repressor